MLAPPPVPGMPLPPGLLPFPHGFPPMPGLPPPGMMPPFGMGMPPPGVPPGFTPRLPENVNRPPNFDQGLRPDGSLAKEIPSDALKEGPRSVVGDPTNHFTRPRGPRPDLDGPKPGFDGPGRDFDGPRPGFRGPPPGFDGPRPDFDGPHLGFDGPRPGFDGPRPGFDGPRPGFDVFRPGFEGPRHRFDGPRPRFEGHRPGFEGPPPWVQQRPRFAVDALKLDSRPDDRREEGPSDQEKDPKSLSWRNNQGTTEKDEGAVKQIGAREGEERERGEPTEKRGASMSEDRVGDKEDRDHERDRGRHWDRDRARGRFDRGGRGMSSKCC